MDIYDKDGASEEHRLLIKNVTGTLFAGECLAGLVFIRYFAYLVCNVDLAGNDTVSTYSKTAIKIEQTLYRLAR